jgi:hypothetical protein
VSVEPVHRGVIRRRALLEVSAKGTRAARVPREWILQPTIELLGVARHIAFPRIRRST